MGIERPQEHRCADKKRVLFIFESNPKVIIPIGVIPSRSPKDIAYFVMSISAFIEGKPGHTPKDDMEETSDDTIYSPSGSSNIVRADIVAYKSTFQVLVKSYLNKCNRNGEESGPKAFIIKERRQLTSIMCHTSKDVSPQGIEAHNTKLCLRFATI